MAAIEYTELADLGDDVLTCKALWTHDWSKNPSPKRIDGQVARIAHRIVCLRCKRCKKERYDYRDVHGRKIGRYYRDPPYYPHTKKLTDEILWGEMIERSLLVQTYNGDEE